MHCNPFSIFQLSPPIVRPLHSPLFSDGFHMKWEDSNVIPFFGWQPSHFSIPCPLWNPYGTPTEWCLPYAIHGLNHMDSMEFPVNLYHKFMHYCSISFNSTGPMLCDMVVEIFILTTFEIGHDINFFFNKQPEWNVFGEQCSCSCTIPVNRDGEQINVTQYVALEIDICHIQIVQNRT